MEVYSFFAMILALLTVYLGVILFAFFLRRRGILPGGRPSYRGLGNAFLRLQNLAEREKQYVLEETEEEEVEQDGEAGPDDPTAYLRHRACDIPVTISQKTRARRPAASPRYRS
jgi:hypothetical protein